VFQEDSRDQTCSGLIVTEVSSNPRRARASRARGGILTQIPIDIATEAFRRDSWSTLESGNRGFGCNELSPQRLKHADRHPIARNDETLSSIECAHDLAAFIAELSLSDLPWHPRSVAPVLPTQLLHNYPAFHIPTTTNVVCRTNTVVRIRMSTYAAAVTP
jgi:hypothetical protein